MRYFLTFRYGPRNKIQCSLSAPPETDPSSFSSIKTSRNSPPSASNLGRKYAAGGGAIRNRVQFVPGGGNDVG